MRPTTPRVWAAFVEKRADERAQPFDGKDAYDILRFTNKVQRRADSAGSPKGFTLVAAEMGLTVRTAARYRAALVKAELLTMVSQGKPARHGKPGVRARYALTLPSKAVPEASEEVARLPPNQVARLSACEDSKAVPLARSDAHLEVHVKEHHLTLVSEA
jgi:hypothetical protein